MVQDQSILEFWRRGFKTLGREFRAFGVGLSFKGWGGDDLGFRVLSDRAVGFLLSVFRALRELRFPGAQTARRQ